MNNNNSSDADSLPQADNRQPLGKQRFCFDCHPGLACYKSCCRRQNLFLYPYDLIRLKRRLGIDSEEFLNRHAGVVKGHNPFFPSLMLQMAADEEQTCPFLGENGCTIYEDRPAACRTYPLERSVMKRAGSTRLEEHYYLVQHHYCQGHGEERQWSAKEWLRDQQVVQYNLLGDLWAEMDGFFATNPWHGEGAAGPRQKVAFLVCYNIDGFRRYARDFDLLDKFRLDKIHRRAIEEHDEELLRFGFDWLKFMLAGVPVLKAKG
jgi:uncharacterized protein